MNHYKKYMESIDLKNKIAARFGDSKELKRAEYLSDKIEALWGSDEVDYGIQRLPSGDMLRRKLDILEAEVKNHVGDRY
ncbi:MAG: hypothetical protein ISN29_05255 [Gammaproteobacteria bacterium AqS3]|nr:hypothetical protein [Gammaproteobacteria bacterium AqS3]